MELFGDIPMLDEPQIITLCGSTKFKDEFLMAARELTIKNWMVLMPGVFGHSDNIDLTVEQKSKLDKLHLEKIIRSSAILVLNIGGYIGASTKSEINFALSRNIKIYYYE